MEDIESTTTTLLQQGEGKEKKHTKPYLHLQRLPNVFNIQPILEAYRQKLCWNPTI